MDTMLELVTQAKPVFEKDQRNTTLPRVRAQGRIWTHEKKLKARPAQANKSCPQEFHRTHMLKGVVERGLTHWQIRAPPPPRTLYQPAGHANPHIESLVQVSSQRRPTSNDLRDQEMSEPLEPLARLKSETQPEAEQFIVKGPTPNAKFHFRILGLKGTQA